MSKDTIKPFSEINRIDLALRLAGLENDFALARFMGTSRQWISQARKINRLSAPMIRRFGNLLGMDEKQAFAIFGQSCPGDGARLGNLVSRLEEQVAKLELLAGKAGA